MEWVFGITDSPPKHWKRREPCWEDEQLTATSSHTFQQLVAKLCETSLRKRRGSGDSGIDHHLWNLKLSSLKQALTREDPVRALFEQNDDDSDDESDDDDDEETNYRGRILIAPREHQQMYEDDIEIREYQFVASDEKLSQALLPRDYVIHFTYDFGTTTDLYLKVLHVRPVAVCKLLQYFEGSMETNKEERDLEAVPTYKLPVEQQIDEHYPHFSKIFLGQHVPLQQRQQEDDSGDQGGTEYDEPHSVVTGSVTLGLSSRVRSDKDTTFCSIENADCSSDLLYASQPFVDMNEFLELAEEAWTPRLPDSDPDHLGDYRYSMVCRQVFPESAEADDAYDNIVERSKSEAAQWGPKLLLFRRRSGDNDDDNKKKIAFDFAKTFPKTSAQFQSGKFRWIKYKNGVLRVLVGRGVGHDHRDFGSDQVLRTWKRDFKSLHELLCAVEASWVYRGKELSADTTLQKCDIDLSPSHPGPREPKLLGKKEDAVVVSKCSDPKKFVTAMAIAQETGKDGTTTTLLYSGHADGTLAKWCLDNNKQLWSKQIYPDGTKDFPHYCDYTGICLRGTAGVAGLVLRTRGSRHLVYTWTDAYEGYPDADFDNRGPSRVQCWRGKDGRHVRSYVCDVGPDNEGEPANPSIATVVFCRLWMDDDEEWVDSMVVGLHCVCQTLDWGDDYSEFDIDRAQEMGEGNILPFYEHSSQGGAMETWREHGGLIQAMAVIPDEYLLSYSIRPGHGLPDAMVLWSLEEPGVPLCRYDFWDPSRSLFKQELTRLSDVVGISVSGSDILFAGLYGDRIAVVTAENDNGDEPSLELHGYGTIGNRFYDDGGFHGCMAMSGRHAVMSHEGSGEAWLFNIEGNADHEKLDRRDGNPHKFDDSRCDDDDDDEAAKYRYSGRELAVGKVDFPLFGANAPRRKKRKFGLCVGLPTESGNESGSDSEIDGGLWTIDKKDGFGEGGPVALAMNGKWVVAGFSNGSITRAPYLPEQFEGNESDTGSYGLVSCSRLPSDEWHLPVLEYEGEEDDDEDEGGDRGHDCCIQ